MPAPHERRTRPLDPRDRDRLDQRPKPIPVIRTGAVRGLYVHMPGDFGRALKIVGFLALAFLTGGRFVASEPLPLLIAIFAGCLAIVAVLMSIVGSSNRLEFVAANQFVDKDEFKRQSKTMHIAEVFVGVIWVAWLGFSLGQFDWLLIGLAVATLLFAFARKLKLTKMSQPRNVWEK